MKNIFDAIREEEAAVERHTRRLEILRQAAGLLVDKEEVTTSTNGTAVSPMLDMAEGVLRETGKPMTTDEMIVAIRTKYRATLKVTQLEPAIYKNIANAKRKRFKKEEAAHTFSLLAWALNQNHDGEQSPV
jgi:hypothetical protein